MSEAQETAIDQLQNRVGVLWRVTQNFEGKGDVPELRTHGKEKVHEFIFPSTYPDAKKDKVMALGMLCMAKLGESRDPLFSTMRFPEGYGINDFEDEQLQAGLIGIDLASQITQVWNHDLMKSVDPELAHQSAVEMLDALEPKSEEDVPDDMFYFVGYAVCNAVIARGKYEDLTGRLLNVKLLIDQKCDSATAEMAGDLAFSFENVAKLPEGSNDALKLYEDYVQKAMMIMELPVYPKIEKDPKTDLNAWTFSMIS